MRFLRLAIGIFAAALSTTPSAHAGSGQRLFEIPRHGLLGLEVMGYWQSELDLQAGDGFPRIFMQHDGGMFTADGSERIRITVKPEWRTPNSPADFGTENGVRQTVREYADQMETLLGSETLELAPVGRGKTGFWFLASDNSFFSRKLDDGFRHVRQGALIVGDLVVSFTILTDDEPSRTGDFAVLLMTHADHLEGTCKDGFLNCYSLTNNLQSETESR